jgi:excisionase family DNA binding protein
MPLTVAPETVLPPADPAEMDRITSFVSESQRTAPPAIQRLLTTAADALAAGSTVRVEPVATLLSTSQAADLLNISRPTLVKLLDEGKLPYEQPSVHRLVHLADVLVYKAARTRGRMAFLDQLAAESAADGELELTLDDYADAIASTRYGEYGPGDKHN